MSLGNSTWSAQSGGGRQSANAAQLARFILQLGVCTAATPNLLINPGDPSTLLSQAGRGPLAEAMAFRQQSGMPCYGMAITPSQPGAIGTVSNAGSGYATMTPSGAPHVPVTAKVTTAGALGTMAVAFSINGGVYGTPVVSSSSGPWLQQPTGVFTKYSFGSGTYVLNDTYAVGIDGSITHGGTGTPTVTATSYPVFSYEMSFTVQTPGGFGTGVLALSPDGGLSNTGGGSTSGSFLIPSNGQFVIPNTGVVVQIGQHTVVFTVDSGGGALGTMAMHYTIDGGSSVAIASTTPNSNGSFVFVVPGTGVSVTFPAGTYVAADTYTISSLGVVTHSGSGTPVATQSWSGVQQNDTFTFLTVPPSHTTSDLSAALTAAKQLRNVQFAAVHVVTMPASAAGAISLQATLDAAMLDANTNYNKDWQGLCEMPSSAGRMGLGDIVYSSSLAIADTADTDAVLKAARGSDTNRTAIHVGSYRGTSSLPGSWKLAFPLGWFVADRFVNTDPGTDLSALKSGPLRTFTPAGAISIGRDESLTPGLDDVQFNTARTYESEGAGVFLSITSGGAGWKNCTTQADWQDARGIRVLDIFVAQLRAPVLKYLGESPATNPDGTIEELTRRSWSSTLNEFAGQAVGLKPGGAFTTRQASKAFASISPASQLAVSPKQLIANYGLQQSGFVSSIANNVFFGALIQNAA